MSRRLDCVLVVALATLSGCDSERAPLARVGAGTDRVVLAWPEFVEFEVTIRPLDRLPARGLRPTVFLHLLDEPGSVVRTFDHPLPGEWRVGRTIVDRVRLYQSALSAPLSAGDYLLSIGIYETEFGRFPLRGRLEEVADREYRIATVVVPPVDDQAPRARFSEEWLPPETGIGRQVLVQRSLSGGGPGRFQFGPLTGPGILTLGLLVPNNLGVGSRIELLDESGQPKVRLETDCGAGEAEVSGVGRFDVDFDVPDAEEGAGCQVRVEPNFRLTTNERSASSSARLEVVAWRPGASGRPTD